MQEQPGIAPTPLEFASDVLGVELWPKQQEVLQSLVEHRRVAVKSGNGLGKGFCAAVVLLWFLHSHQDAAIALSTAPAFRQVRHILWRQVHRLYRPNAEQLGGKMLDTSWEISDGRYAMGLSAENADQFQGFHSPDMLIVVDEAEGVSDEIYEAIEAVMTAADPLLLLIGNPTTVTGAFRRAFYEERHLYHNITISALDSPNVQAGKTIVPGLTSARWVEERRETWGEDNPIYRARVLGEFPDQAEDTLINLSDVEAAAERWARPENSENDESEVFLAVDVARLGSDRSVILHRQGERVVEIRTFRDMDTMQLAGWVAAAISETEPERVCVDEIGVGAGVVDRLKEQGHPVQGINVARRAQQERLFTNVRAEGYWCLKELFASGQIAIPNDHQLMGELAALRYSFDSQGRVLMESKEAMRQRGLPSPDKADALMLAFLESTNKTRLWI
jgi:hypothetical protein